MNVVISDDIEQRFRKAIADYKGMKKGNVSEAAEEAFELWITEIEHRLSGKVKIK